MTTGNGCAMMVMFLGSKRFRLSAQRKPDRLPRDHILSRAESGHASSMAVSTKRFAVPSKPGVHPSCCRDDRQALDRAQQRCAQAGHSQPARSPSSYPFAGTQVAGVSFGLTGGGTFGPTEGADACRRPVPVMKATCRQLRYTLACHGETREHLPRWARPSVGDGSPSLRAHTPNTACQAVPCAVSPAPQTNMGGFWGGLVMHQAVGHTPQHTGAEPMPDLPAWLPKEASKDWTWMKELLGIPELDARLTKLERRKRVQDGDTHAERTSCPTPPLIPAHTPAARR